MRNGKFMTPVELARDFWEKKCLYHIQMFEYGKYSKKDFIRHMVNMGWKESDIKI